MDAPTAPETQDPAALRGQLEQRFKALEGRIVDACASADRARASVTLIAVTKTHPPEVARVAVELGVRDLGENRVKELLAKRERVEDARWHLIGRLQSRKARDVVGRALLVHSVDRRSLADALSRRAKQRNVVQRVLIQVNVGEDPAKGGCRVDGALELVAYARDLPNIAVEGLMTMPPSPPEGTDANEHSRPLFATLRQLRDDARERWPEISHLSMGMTADLEAAVVEGATMIRVGTALFGPRADRPWEPVT